jgi:DNA polymerase III epsilon subunit-like protein
MNVIFWDSEFSSLDPHKGELLSVGMIKPNGEELYFELQPRGTIDPWVKKNVTPMLTGKKISRAEATRRIAAFCGGGKSVAGRRPHLVAYVNQFDVIYLYKLLKAKTTTKDYPFHWIHYDFATMLAAKGYDPESLTHTKLPAFARKIGIDTSWRREHHALDDAKLVKMVFDKIMK